MIQEVWLYALGGFLIGFLFSTVWESLYFRQKRMRIAETNAARPEAEAQTPIAPPEPPAPESTAEVDDWPQPGPPWLITVSTHEGWSLPQTYMRRSVPRAAFSHSASVGNRLPTELQKAVA